MMVVASIFTPEPQSKYWSRLSMQQPLVARRRQVALTTNRTGVVGDGGVSLAMPWLVSALHLLFDASADVR